MQYYAEFDRVVNLTQLYREPNQLITNESLSKSKFTSTLSYS